MSDATTPTIASMTALSGSTTNPTTSGRAPSVTHVYVRSARAPPITSARTARPAAPASTIPAIET